jgi:hypothetical protein
VLISNGKLHEADAGEKSSSYKCERIFIIPFALLTALPLLAEKHPFSGKENPET